MTLSASWAQQCEHIRSGESESLKFHEVESMHEQRSMSNMINYGSNPCTPAVLIKLVHCHSSSFSVGTSQMTHPPTKKSNRTSWSRQLWVALQSVVSSFASRCYIWVEPNTQSTFVKDLTIIYLIGFSWGFNRNFMGIPWFNGIVFEHSHIS